MPDLNTPKRGPAWAAIGTLALTLTACGGGGGALASRSSGPESVAASAPADGGTAAANASTTRLDAYRLLTQGSFGPKPDDVTSVAASGAAAWVDAQLALASSTTFVARWDTDNAAVQLQNPSLTADGNSIISQFYYHAMNGQDQLRQRVAFALSEIMVVSLQGIPVSQSRAAAAYLDMLNRDAFGNYRALLQDVALSPAMGIYLNSMHNIKENPATGQIPDQNFAREVMQLFSIGLVQLNPNGSKKLVNGQPVQTYTPDDIFGMSKVFTGWSWAGPDTSDPRFYGDPSAQAPDRLIQPMQGYTKYHSTSEKDFLGAAVPPQSTPDPAASLKTALDTLANHPNVGPFIGRQLIQRLVESNPSQAYVSRVAAVFNDNGSGVRGDLKAVVRAILLDPEARAAKGTSYGKVREPVLRLTAWMRAFNASSDAGNVLMWNTDDPGLALAQSPLRSTTVFNFFRPGYVAPGTQTGAQGLTMPELQITDETTTAGYINFMTSTVSKGVGQIRPHGTYPRADVQPDYSAELALVDNTSALVDEVARKLVGDGVSDTLESKIRTAVDSVPIPVANQWNGNQVSAAKNNRVYTAVLLTLSSPEFIVQK
jgi:uncharacterized protein (DUF1800 family)